MMGAIQNYKMYCAVIGVVGLIAALTLGYRNVKKFEGYDQRDAGRVGRSGVGWVVIPFIVSIFLEPVPGYILVAVGILCFGFISYHRLMASDLPANVKEKSVFPVLLATVSLLLIMVQIVF